MAGHRYYDSGLDPADLSRFGLILRTGDVADLAPADQQALKLVGDTVPVLAEHEVSDRALAELAPIEVWGPDGISVFPRVSADPESRVVVCHLLNRMHFGAGGPVRPLRFVSIGLRPSACLGEQVVSATWHAPGQEPVSLEPELLPGIVRLVVPELGEWGVLRLEFGN